MREMDTYDKGEKGLYQYVESDPLVIRERKQTQLTIEVMKEKAQWGEFYRVYGLLMLLLGGYWLLIPFYNVVCQAFGTSMRTGHKDYKFADDKINVFRKFRVSFISHV